VFSLNVHDEPHSLDFIVRGIGFELERNHVGDGRHDDQSCYFRLDRMLRDAKEHCTGRPLYEFLQDSQALGQEFMAPMPPDLPLAR